MYFRVNEFEVDVNDSIFSGNEQQKMYKVEQTEMVNQRLYIAMVLHIGDQNSLTSNRA